MFEKDFSQRFGLKKAKTTQNFLSIGQRACIVANEEWREKRSKENLDPRSFYHTLGILRLEFLFSFFSSSDVSRQG